MQFTRSFLRSRSSPEGVCGDDTGDDDSAAEATAAEVGDEANLVRIDPAFPKKRPDSSGGIALALGGGAARGWAHIGVLRAFDEANVEISMIAGTSIGALAGGCYLAGELDSLEAFARSITRSNMLRFMDFTLRGSGLIRGERLVSRMSKHISDMKVENLPKPFVSICADIDTGHEVWLKQGSLINAIRASYALPGVFQPVRLGDRVLVDGAIVNPVPVSACRSYEPDAVIAVNLNSETFGKGTVIQHNYNQDIQEKATGHSRLGVTGIMMESFNIIQDRIARSRLAGDPPDFTIRPQMRDVGLTEFHRASEAIDAGYEEGCRRLAELRNHGMLDGLCKNIVAS